MSPAEVYYFPPTRDAAIRDAIQQCKKLIAEYSRIEADASRARVELLRTLSELEDENL
jgi:hypothetical protein